MAGISSRVHLGSLLLHKNAPYNGNCISNFSANPKLPRIDHKSRFYQRSHANIPSLFDKQDRISQGEWTAAPFMYSWQGLKQPLPSSKHFYSMPFEASFSYSQARQQNVRKYSVYYWSAFTESPYNTPHKFSQLISLNHTPDFFQILTKTQMHKVNGKATRYSKKSSQPFRVC